MLNGKTLGQFTEYLKISIVLSLYSSILAIIFPVQSVTSTILRQCANIIVILWAE